MILPPHPSIANEKGHLISSGKTSVFIISSAITTKLICKSLVNPFSDLENQHYPESESTDYSNVECSPESL